MIDFNIKFLRVGFLFTFFCFNTLPASVMAQDSEEKFSKHHHLIVSIGHGFVPSGVQVSGANEFVSIPIWGLDYEFIFSERFALGLMNDLEVSNYIITDEEGTEIEREYPLSSSIYFQYNPLKGLGFFVGPGIEIEKNENLFIATIGGSYEVQIAETWDLAPEISYVLKGGHTGAITFSLCVGKRFGK